MTSELGSSNTMVEWANECDTGQLASREAGDGAHWDREAGSLARTESLARESRHVIGCQHPAVFNIFQVFSWLVIFGWDGTGLRLF